MTAWKDIWFIGDAFVNDIYHELQNLQESRKRHKQSLYIYQEFNVKCFTTNPLANIKNVAVRLLNAFIKALNDNNKLPKYVVFIPDWDLISYINYFESDVKQVIFNI